MAKYKIKPAFPGRSSSLGYEQGLTKLEWIVTQLMSANEHMELTLAIKTAKQIIEACEAAEASDT